MPGNRDVSRYDAFHFRVRDASRPELAAGFMEASGLDREAAVEDYRAGSDRTGSSLRKIFRKPKRVEPSRRVAFRRGRSAPALFLHTGSLTDRSTQGRIAPCDLVVELLNEAHQVVFRWFLRDSRCLKVSGPSLDAKSNDVAIELVELVCERIEVDEAP